MRAAIVRWPERLKAGSICREMLSSLDVLPLAVSAAGGVLPADRIIDGKNPLPALAGESPSPHESLFWFWNQGRREQWRSLRQGPWKLTRRADAEPWQLYHLEQDISESTDLAAQEPERVRDLSQAYERWHQTVLNDPSRSPSLR